MRRYYMKVFCLLLGFSPGFSHSQVPANDKNLVLIESSSDEFDESEINTQKWNMMSPWGQHQPAVQTDDGSNHSISNGILTMSLKKTDKYYEGELYHYTKPELMSTATFRYGYFEIKMNRGQ